MGTSSVPSHLLGNAFDRDTSPPSLSLLHVNSGNLAGSGSPRDFVPGGVTPVERLAAVFGQEPANGIEWYFPRKLTIDTNGANSLTQDDVADYLGLRVLHQRKVSRRCAMHKMVVSWNFSSNTR